MKTEAILLHEQLKGKIEVTTKSNSFSKKDLSLLYSPGVAEPCLEIEKNPDYAYETTWKGNTVAVVSDGTAVLGLGNIGALASLPVMEGKAMLFKAFADVNAVPIVLNTKSSDELISIVTAMAPTFGGINLEDIKAPECVYIERELKRTLNIPVFHDDQHGTAIVVMAGLINACKLTGRTLADTKIVVSGTGAAGSSIIKMLHEAGVRKIYGTNSKGIVSKAKYDSYDFLVKELTEVLNDDVETIQEAFIDADIFIGVSAPGIISQEMVRSMSKDPIIFALANPDPEITYDDAKAAGARVVGTGRSDYPNQVNNVLAFPGIFKGALEARVPQITEKMKWAAAYAIASLVEEDLSETHIMPDPMDPRLADTVAKAIIKEHHNENN